MGNSSWDLPALTPAWPGLLLARCRAPPRGPSQILTPFQIPRDRSQGRRGASHSAPRATPAGSHSARRPGALGRACLACATPSDCNEETLGSASPAAHRRPGDPRSRASPRGGKSLPQAPPPTDRGNLAPGDKGGARRASRAGNPSPGTAGRSRTRGQGAEQGGQAGGEPE